MHTFLGLDQLKPRPKHESKGSPNSKRKTKRSVGVCWRFAEGRPCRSKPCEFKHECADNGDAHKLGKCKKEK